ncbi:aquaporin-11-like [Nerophis ophidion]|uniref:aquaporin-11-like n=1 Tax=Nerophis ophidion TaxID=159077 RepID=UPI002ADF0EF3|nr:aquaporin-11-like [Nerophis ophidion]
MNVWVSLAVLAVAVLLSEVARRAAIRLLRGASRAAVLEAASTFQLCCCTHELKLLADAVEPAVSLTLCYAITVVHLQTFRGASCNPCGVVERVCRGSCGFGAALSVIAAQFSAALAARHFAASVWSQGLSESHVTHRRFGFRCFDPLGGTVLEAAAVELACAFAVQAVALHAHKVDEKLRVHVFAAVVTALVYTGGSISGAVFNPVLAFSVQFPCSGHTYLEYCFIYWLGPALEKYQLDHKATTKENNYQERNQTATPALPPRTQFLLAEAQSYENITEHPDSGQSSMFSFQQITAYPHDHDLNQEDPRERKQILDLQHDDNPFQDHEQNLAEVSDYEEVAEQSGDYVKVYDEGEVHPPLMEDYDDIAGKDQDYDDLG